MDFLGNGIGKQSMGLDIGYNNYNSSGVKEDVFVQKGTGNEGVRDLQQMPVGKAFRGEITDITGNKVSIKLDNGQQVQARLAEDMNFNIGDKILFQVKSNGGGTIEIKPIKIALQGQEGAILRALEAANMPVNDKTVALLYNLLKEQMPIDKTSIQNLYKQVLANAQTDVQTLVTMNKLNIPITKENIGQFEAYKNYEHRIAAQANELSTQLTNLLQEVTGENPSAGKQLHMELLQLFTSGNAATGKELNALSAEGQQMLQGQNAEAAMVQNADGQNAESILQMAASNENEIAVPTDGAMTDTLGTEVKGPGNMFQLPGLGEMPGSATESNQTFTDGQIGNILTAGERQELFTVLRELSIPEDMKAQLLSGEGKVSDLLEQLQIQLKQYIQFDTESLLQSESYTKLLKSHINEQWFMKPEQLAAGERMEEFYENLRTQTQQLETLLSTIGKNDSMAFKTANGMKDNIDFMNQINQMFTYVQIPLMMSGKTAHSDLYVFTKKKSLRDQEGKVSALLHLDMEGLGNLDVYVEMDGMDVQTQFKLADEELVRLFEDNIDFLTKRIVEKGYRFSSKVEISNDKVDFVEDFLERDHGNAPMQRFAFDVRA